MVMCRITYQLVILWYRHFFSVYEKQTGLKGHEQIIGGGTFGRLLKRGVAYGCYVPWLCQYHAPKQNEFTEVEGLIPCSCHFMQKLSMS